MEVGELNNKSSDGPEVGNDMDEPEITDSHENVEDLSEKGANCEESKIEKEDNNDITDPYSYLNRGDFSSENYKIELKNLPKRFGIARETVQERNKFCKNFQEQQLRKKLVHEGLKPCKIKTTDHQGCRAFVTFRSEEDKAKAFEVLQSHSWKNRNIQVKNAAPIADPLMLKRKQEADGHDQHKSKMAKLEETVINSTATPTDRVNDSVAPLWKILYDEQLQIKQKVVVSAINKLGDDINRNNQNDKAWLANHRSVNGGFCCQLHPIKPSPLVVAYRNKCKFTIGMDPEEKDKTVGFRVGSYKDGDVSVLEPVGCVNIPDSMHQVTRLLQSYLQKHPLKSFNPTNREGYWKEATVRTTQSGDVMLTVTIHPQTLSKADLENERALLKQYFEGLAESSPKVTSLYFQAESDRTDKDEDGVCDHLLGEESIQEQLLGMKFKITPLSFFQVNTLAAELLYSTIADWCQITATTTLLDVCCGTGSIGLTMAKRVKKVIGIELNSQAIKDAKENALKNEFICGKAEDCVPSLMRRVGGEEVVVVVDPPRSGLHSDVVRAIRKSPVNRVVYVSCKLEAVSPNILDFTRQVSKRVTGNPFRLMEAVPIDLFPNKNIVK